MNESTTWPTKQFTSSASLAAIGIKLTELKLFEPIKQTVQIAQKTVKDTPTDKLYDALISLLAGAQGLVEINTRLRADSGLQRAFGRSRCCWRLKRPCTWMRTNAAEPLSVWMSAGALWVMSIGCWLATTRCTVKTIRASRPNAWPGASLTGTVIPNCRSASSAG